jgi:hypothetical protein
LKHLPCEQQTPGIDLAWLREQSPIDFYYFLEDFAVFLAAGFLAFMHLHREQKATGINRSRLREQRLVNYYFLAFFAAGFLAFAGLLALLQNFT